MKRKIGLIILICLVAVTLSSCEKKDKDRYKIALITMDSVQDYWVQLREGAEKGADEVGAELVYLAPIQAENSQQIELIHYAQILGCDAIVIAANDPTGSNFALKEAMDNGIKVVYVDAPGTLPAEVTFATDGVEAGYQAGLRAIELLKEKGITSGPAGVIGHTSSSFSSVNRCAGFIKAMEEAGFRMFETQYAEVDQAKAQLIAETYIQKGAVAIFAIAEAGANGLASTRKSMNADVVCIGFDLSETEKAYIRDGSLDGVMLQRPAYMGEMGVKTAVDVLKNGTDYGGEFIDTGIIFVNRDNVDEY